MKLSDSQIASIVEAEEQAALDYEGEIARERTMLMDYYNMQPFGDEIEGQSSAISSDVSDVVETILPGLIRLFTQSRVIAKFEADNPQYDDEADQKTELANYAFMVENNGVLTLHNMFKDALLQFTGVVKVCYEEEDCVRTTKYEGLSEVEYLALMNDPEVKSVEEVEVYQTEFGIEYECEGVRVSKSGFVRYDNIPPEEFLICRSARDFVKPRFIGHRSPKTRSELISMGFDKKIVNSLPADEVFEGEEQKNARYHDYDDYSESNPTNHRPNDLIYLGEYYQEMDVDGDGVVELWKVFYAGRRVLEKEQVEDHPFAVCVPIPIPHRAIGTCPAKQVADLQYRKSHLERNLYDNVYQTNYPRIAHSNKVNLDDLLTPRAGGTIEIDTDVADVGGHIQPVVIPNMIGDILGAIEYTNTARETRTGITRYSQGLDAEALNQTATGFKGLSDASKQREYLIAQIFASGGVKQIFTKTIDVISKYQDTEKQIRILGEPVEINPRDWRGQTRCVVNIGLGSSDRQERIMNLNNVLAIQERFMQTGLLLSDQATVYRTLEKLIDEIGLKDVQYYFNNPEIPAEVAQAQLEIAMKQMAMMQQQLQQNPLAEAELIKAQARMAEVQGKETNSMRQFILKMAQEDSQFRAQLAKDLTELELKYTSNIPGSLV